MIKVTVWNENQHEKRSPKICELYPGGLHEYIASFLRSEEVEVRCATLDDEECGLTDEVLDDTDVLVWWGHMAHAKVPDEVVDRVQKHVHSGMGLIALHSAHKSKIFMRLLGTSADLLWREADERERLWVVDPSHPIAKGVSGQYVEIPHEEMYGEPFNIPTPDELVFIGWFQGGEVFRSGCVFKRSRGKIFYFQPGHETNAVYSIKEIQRIILNAIDYVKPTSLVASPFSSRRVEPCEKI